MNDQNLANKNKAVNSQPDSRKSRWISSLNAFAYLSRIQKNEAVDLRESDKATTLVLLLCCLAALIYFFLPHLEVHNMILMAMANALVGIALFIYVINRFGIILTVAPKQAVLIWQLILGSSLFGIFFAINLALLLKLFLPGCKIFLLP